jgi:hypothetical protein
MDIHRERSGWRDAQPRCMRALWLVGLLLGGLYPDGR